jgi:glucosamine-6-phosphate deaminase
MEIHKASSKKAASQAAAHLAASTLRKAIKAKGRVCFVAATGASQFDFLEALTADGSIDWAKTTMFHLDEYVGLSETHPASFRRYLRERLVDIVHPGTVHFIKGDTDDPLATCERLNRLISQYVIDVAFVGIGENGHLAFNDPPADFETEAPYIVVNLDESCRRQQVGEGWFAGIEDVPRQAISMSIQQIMKAKMIVCTVPDKRKAQAARDCLEGEVTPEHPASILQRHSNVHIFLDPDSASLLTRR